MLVLNLKSRFLLILALSFWDIRSLTLKVFIAILNNDL